MNKSADKRTRNHVAQALCVLLLLSFLIAILGVEVRRNAATYGREAAKAASFTVTESFSGYVFRDETTLHSSNNGPIEYLVADGSAVNAGNRLVNVYVDDTGADQRQTAASL